MERVGFIGLGIMGCPMSKNLLAKNPGMELLVYDIDKAATEQITAVGAVAASPAEIGGCDVIFTILPNGDIVYDTILAMKDTLHSGSLFVDMSSVTPEDSRKCAEKLAEFGVEFLDAPVSGGEPKAIDGTLSFMVGGSEAAYSRALPLFMSMGASSVHIGAVGTGSITKLANQVIVNLTIAAVSEGLVLATKAGADPEKVYKAIRGGLAGSTVLDAKAPMILERNFKAGGKISVNHKDIKNVLTCAHSADVPLPLSATLFEIMQSLKIDGLMENDHGAIVRFYEKLAGVEVRPYSEDAKQ